MKLSLIILGMLLAFLSIVPAPVLAAGSCACTGNISITNADAAIVAGVNLADICATHGGTFSGSLCSDAEVAKNIEESECDLPINDDLLADFGLPDDGSFNFGTLVASCSWNEAESLSPPPSTPASPAPADPNVVNLENPIGVGQKGTTEATAIIATVIRTALGIIGALTLLMLVWGGFQWLTSAGNPEKVKMGTQTMVWAIIGVMLVFASFLLLSTFTKILTTGTA